MTAVMQLRKPQPEEVPPYFTRYVDKVVGADVLAVLERQAAEVQALLGGLTDAQADYRYEPEKWNIREIIGHLADAERIFVYRALAFARADATPLPGFEEDEYVANARFAERPLADLLNELATVRAATLAFFRGLNDAELSRTGTAGQRTVTVRALASVIAGHEAHHLGVIRERYLTPAGA